MEAAKTYRAVHTVSPGRLELTEKPFQTPGPGKVRIRVEACGVCHSEFRHSESSVSNRMAARPGP